MLIRPGTGRSSTIRLVESSTSLGRSKDFLVRTNAGSYLLPIAIGAHRYCFCRLSAILASRSDALRSSSAIS